MRYAFLVLFLLSSTPALACESLLAQAYFTVRSEEDATVMQSWAKQTGIDVRREAADKLVFLIGKEANPAESAAVRKEGMNNRKIGGHAIPRQIKIAIWGSRLRCA